MDALQTRPTVHKARRVRLFHKPGQLSPLGVEALFRCADVLSEGAILEPGSSYFGSTFLTFDLEALAQLVREPLEPSQWEALRDAAEGSVQIRLRAMREAIAAASQRFPDCILGTADVEMRVRLRGMALLIDVDIEVPVSEGLPCALSDGVREESLE